MKYVLRVNGLVTQTRGQSQPGFEEAPDTVECFWEKVGETWQKSAILLSMEAIAADLATKRGSMATNLSTVRGWITFAQDTVVAGWDAATTQQKMDWVKQHINRDAIVWKHLADLVEGYKL